MGNGSNEKIKELEKWAEMAKLELNSQKEEIKNLNSQVKILKLQKKRKKAADELVMLGMIMIDARYCVEELVEKKEDETLASAIRRKKCGAKAKLALEYCRNAGITKAHAKR